MKTARMKKKSLLLRLMIFAVSAYVAVSFVSLQVEITTKRTQLDLVLQQIESQRIANDETERLINLGDDETYLSRIARDRLDMGLPDERVFRDSAGS